MELKIIKFSRIGDVQFVPSVTAKYLRISVKPFVGIQVTVPKRISMKEAAAFVESKINWIIQAQARIAKQENRYTVFTPETVFSTRNRQLQLFPWKSGQFRTQLTKDCLKIFYPHETDIRSNQAQEKIREIIIDTLRKEAKEYLPQRTEHFATMHGFDCQGVTVKNITSRWGSCSSTNHINLNIHLLRLPQHLLDYVILHELTHTVHKNHGKYFWQSLNKITGGKAKQLAAEMRQYHAVWF